MSLGWAGAYPPPYIWGSGHRTFQVLAVGTVRYPFLPSTCSAPVMVAHGMYEFVRRRPRPRKKHGQRVEIEDEHGDETGINFVVHEDRTVASTRVGGLLTAAPTASPIASGSDVSYTTVSRSPARQQLDDLPAITSASAKQVVPVSKSPPDRRTLNKASRQNCRILHRL